MPTPVSVETRKRRTKKDFVMTAIAVTKETAKRTIRPKKMGEVTTAVIPSQPLMEEIFFVAKFADDQLKNKVRMSNRLKAMLKLTKSENPDEVEEKLKALQKESQKSFNIAKKMVTDLVGRHPLYARIGRIRGMSEYQLGMVMYFIRDIRRFPMPSRLATYAGVAPSHGLFTAKMNLNRINELKHENFIGREEEFTRFAPSLEFRQRLNIIADGFIKIQGFFYWFYKRTKERLLEKHSHDEYSFVATAEDAALSDGSMTVGNRYMRGKNCQPLTVFVHRGAIWRMMRLFLEIVYEEWAKLEGIEVREAYVFEYLGHQTKYTLDGILAYEERNPRIFRKDDVELDVTDTSNTENDIEL